MATVTGYTVAKMKEIFDQTIKFLSISSTGDLIATRNDNTESNLGSVLGVKGDKGDQGPPGTTPAVLQQISQGAGGTLTPGETSATMKITADLKANHWYGIKHLADISAAVDGGHALYLVFGSTQMQCLWRKASGQGSTREVISPEHIWKQVAATTGTVIGLKNSAASDGSIVYMNDGSEPRQFTLLDYGPAT